MCGAMVAACRQWKRRAKVYEKAPTWQKTKESANSLFREVVKLEEVFRITNAATEAIVNRIADNMSRGCGGDDRENCGGDGGD
jgi:signal-transduction protein with cAMP-binding, CBS, and nucleotidyltransferase domain